MTPASQMAVEPRVVRRGALAVALVCALAGVGYWLLGDRPEAVRALVTGLAFLVVAVLYVRVGAVGGSWSAAVGLGGLFLTASWREPSPVGVAFFGVLGLLVVFLGGWRRARGPMLMVLVMGAVSAEALREAVGQPGPAAREELVRAVAMTLLLSGAGVLFERIRARALARADSALGASRLANQTQRRFFARVSQDLTTPLRGILEVVDALGAEPLSTQGRQDLSLLGRSAQAMLEQARLLILVTRARLRDLESSEGPVDLRALVEEQVRQAEARAGQPVTLVAEGPPELVLRSEQHWLGEAVRLLLVDAALAAGGRGVTVRLWPGAGGSASVAVSSPRRAPGSGGLDFDDDPEGPSTLELGVARGLARAFGWTAHVSSDAERTTARLDVFPAGTRRTTAAPAPRALRPSEEVEAWRARMLRQVFGVWALGVSVSSGVAALAGVMGVELRLVPPFVLASVGCWLAARRGQLRVAVWLGSVGLQGLIVLAAVWLRAPVLGAFIGAVGLMLLLLGGRAQAAVVLTSTALSLAGLVVVFTSAAPLQAPVLVVDVWRAVGLAFTVGALGWVSERARALAYERAVQQRDAAVRAGERQTRFLQQVSHELRTPLNAIEGLAQSLAGEALSPSGARALQTLLRSSHAMLSLVHALIDGARARTAVVSLTPSPMDLAAACEDVVALTQRRAQRRGVACQPHTEGARVWVLADEARLRQLLSAMVDTALAAPGAGELTVTAAATTGGPGGAGVVRLEVTRTGAAGPVALAALVDGAPTPSPERELDPALELAIARDVLAAMHGSLLVEGGGARLVAELQLPLAPAPAPKTPVPSRVPGQVLVVDDTPVNLVVVQRLLGKLCAQVTCADSGEAALALTQGQRFDLVLMDLQMPGIDGLETTRRLRARGYDGPVVALTASALPGTRDECLRSGMNECLVKPVRLESLAHTLLRFTDDGRRLAACPHHDTCTLACTQRAHPGEPHAPVRVLGTG